MEMPLLGDKFEGSAVSAEKLQLRYKVRKPLSAHWAHMVVVQSALHLPGYDHTSKMTEMEVLKQRYVLPGEDRLLPERIIILAFLTAADVPAVGD